MYYASEKSDEKYLKSKREVLEKSEASLLSIEDWCNG